MPSVTCLRRAICLLLLVGSASVTDAKDPIHTAEQPLPPAEAAATMVVPEGFRVSLFAGEPDVRQPIGFCIDDRARLWVAEAYNYPVHGDRSGDRIVILEDSDGDGRADSRTVFYDQLNYVTGIEVGFGGVWVMSPPNFYFIPDRNGDDIPDQQPQLLLDGFGNHANAHNLANGFAWGPDGWLYGTHGRTNWSLIGKPGADDQQRIRFDGGVYRYHPTRHLWEPYADGTTNPWGIDWNDVGDAFVCNCVNPHLFQVIQGAHYEPWRGRASSQYAYQRIDTIADHLHFVGLGNVRNGLGSDDEDQAGGGHAHCGTMIYLGDQFPSQYRNQLFTNNIHGRRINNDRLRRLGSGYVASHGPDLMRSRDPWYMGVTLAYGPSGEVYASDWSDTGECHSTRNTRKQTGRIYRISYLENRRQAVDMAALSDQELVARQWHGNDWHVRHARRLLQERAAAGEPMADVHQLLRQRLESDRPVTQKLRALWALWVTGGLTDSALLEQLDSEHEEIRSWATTLICEDRRLTAGALRRLVVLAELDPSPRVRLSLASAAQRLEPASAWPLVEQLARHGEDADDANLPLMYWYAFEPLIQDDLARFVELAGNAALSRLRINAARRVGELERPQEGLELLSRQLIGNADSTIAADLLEGLLLGLEGRRQLTIPESWREAYAPLQRSSNRQVADLAVRVALLFSDDQAIDSLRATMIDTEAEPLRRRRAIKALIDSGESFAGSPSFADQLLELLEDAAVREVAITGLSRYPNPAAAGKLVQLYPDLSVSERQLAIEALASRTGWATSLLDAVQANKIDPADLTAYHARQIQTLGDAALSARLKELWGEVRDSPADRAREIAGLRKWLNPDVLARADYDRGKQLFTQHCANCHTFFGEGGQVGPDITGAQRNNLDYLLENIIDPNASVSKDYRMQVILTTDGRVINGLIESESPQTLAVLTATERIVLPTSDIQHRKVSNQSIMPTGLLENLDEQSIRDLFGYLQRR